MAIDVFDINYEDESITYEERLVIHYAAIIAFEHEKCYQTAKNKVDSLLDKKGKLSKVEEKELQENLAILDVLNEELISDVDNPYNFYANAMRFWYVNEEIVTRINELRLDPNIDDTARDNQLQIEFEKLRNILASDSDILRQEVADISNRTAVMNHLISIYRAKGLMGSDSHGEHSPMHEYFDLGLEVSDLVLKATRTALLVAKSFEHLRGGLSGAGAGLALLGVVATLITTDYKNMSGTLVFNTVGMALDAFLGITSESLAAARELGPEALAAKLTWVPIVGFVATALMIGFEVANMAIVETKYREKLTKLAELSGDTSGWRSKDTELTAEQQELRQALIQHISLNEVISHPEAIKALFTREEFENIKPQLIEHAKHERDKLLIRHASTISIALLIGVAGLISFLMPGIGIPMTIAIVSTVIATFVAKLILYKTVLEEKDTISLKGFADKVAQHEKSLSSPDKPATLAQNIQTAFDSIETATFVDPLSYRPDSIPPGLLATMGAEVITPHSAQMLLHEILPKTSGAIERTAGPDEPGISDSGPEEPSRGHSPSD